MDGSFRQKINKEILDLNYMVVQMGLTDIYRTFHPTTAECTCFSSVHGILSRIDNMLDHKTSLHKFKVEIILTIFSNHMGN